MDKSLLTFRNMYEYTFSNMNQKKLDSLGPKFLLSTHIFSSPGWCPAPGSMMMYQAWSPPVPGPTMTPITHTHTSTTSHKTPIN